MTIIFTNIATAGSVVHQNGDRYLVSIPATGWHYGYIHKNNLRYVTHGKAISGQDVYLADSRAFEPVDNLYIKNLVYGVFTEGPPNMLRIQVQPDSYMWLYAEIYNNAGDPYYLNPVSEDGTQFLYTGPGMETLESILRSFTWCTSCVLIREEGATF